MTSDGEITEDDLIAFADDRLSSADHARVEAWLENHPERAEEVAAWRRQTLDLRTAFPEIPASDTPLRLDPHRIARQLDASRPRKSVIAFATAAALVIGVGFGWFGNMVLAPRPGLSDSFMSAALAAHTIYTAEGRHAVEVRADEEEHLTAWLSNRLDRRLIAPDLSSDGFSLVGGRLLSAETIPAAQLMYEDGSGARITLYFTGEVPEDGAPYRFSTSGDLAALFWKGDTLTCTIVGDLPRAELEDIARKAYDQLSWPGANGDSSHGAWS